MSILRGRGGHPQRHEDVEEKPYWISFSDLMTALMVLFLVALTVALLAVTHTIAEGEREKELREKEIAQLLQRLRSTVEKLPGVEVRGSIIAFGDRARFDTDSHRLTETQMRVLRGFVPIVLALARDPAGEKWLKRVVVEGFADARGSYLHNLHLSLQRSERVLCALLLPGAGGEVLSEGDRRLIRALFLVSGASFNAQKSSPEESRRIEMRLEFRQMGESAEATPVGASESDLRCPLDVR